MGYRLNIFTGALDLVSSGGSGGGINRIGPTTDKSITRWLGNSADNVQGSKTLLQDGGGIEAQGFVTRTLITDQLTIRSEQVMVTGGFSVEAAGELVIESDGELIVV